MTGTSLRLNRFRWKWVGISFALYLLFYLLPLFYAGGVLTGNDVTQAGTTFIGIWAFGGIVLIAAIAGYLSTGVTIIEPALGGIAMVTVWFATYVFYLAPPDRPFTLKEHAITLIVMVSVFVLSLLGAWLGEFVQKIRNRSRRPAAD